VLNQRRTRGKPEWTGFTVVEPLFDKLRAVSERERKAFTLVELLVVIAIIGILIALLLPAIQAAREASRRSQCANHLKQIGLAVQNFESSRGKVPPAYLSGTGHATWLVLILPYLEESVLYENSNAKKIYWGVPPAFVQSQVSVYYCPSRRAPGLSVSGDDSSGCSAHVPGALADYALNGGDHQAWIYWYYGTDRNGIARHTFELENAAPGYLVGSCPDTTVSRWTAQRKLKDVTDGLSQTFLVGEKYMHPEYFGQRLYGDNSFFNDNHVNNYVRQAGIQTSNHNFFIVPSPNYTDDKFQLRNYLTRNFGSSHSGGRCQFVYCDGSVHAIDPSVDQVTLGRLANIHDGEVISSFE
jgi:prepilin-type N-terminal cleavage/methylation domain-containing protein/prepilin-type processing-associated H-X9-DG protein